MGKGSTPRNCHTQAFRDNHDAIFGKKPKPAKKSTSTEAKEAKKKHCNARGYHHGLG